MPMADDPLQAEARALTAEWQERLRLRDWDVETEVVPRYELDRDSHGRAGDIIVFQPKRHASIRVRHPEQDSPTERPVVNMELNIVHELLHITLDGWRVDGDTWDDHMKEQAIHAISSALVALKRKDTDNGR